MKQYQQCTFRIKRTLLQDINFVQIHDKNEKETAKDQ